MVGDEALFGVGGAWTTGVEYFSVEDHTGRYGRGCDADAFEEAPAGDTPNRDPITRGGLGTEAAVELTLQVGDELRSGARLYGLRSPELDRRAHDVGVVGISVELLRTP